MKVSNQSNKEAVDISGLSRSKKGDKAGAAGKAKDNAAAIAAFGPGDAAAVELSSDAKTISQATKIAKSDNVDQEKIDRIKAMINSGTYKPDFGKVAERMVNEQVMQELA